MNNITSYTKLINDLAKEVKLISRKALTKDLRNKYNIPNSAKYFSLDRSENYLVFQLVCRYFKNVGNTDNISAWKSKGISDESIKSPATFGNSLATSMKYIVARSRIKYDGQCLKQDKVTFTHKKVVNIYIVYKTHLWTHTQGAGITLENYLFGAAKLTKNADFDKCKYSGQGIGFDARERFLLSDDSGFGKNIIICAY